MLIASVFVARILGKTGFGELGMVQSTVGMFGVFAGFGLGLTATKHVAEFRRSDPARAGRIIALSNLVAAGTGGLMALCLFVFAPWLATHTINAPHLAGVLRIGALILYFSALNGAQTGALSGFEAFRAIAHVNLFAGVISFPLVVAGAWWGGLTGAVWALAASLGFNWLVNALALRKVASHFGVPVTFRDCRRELSILWSFSLPVVLAGAVVSPIVWVCSAVLVNQPDGYGEMGILNASNQWGFLLMFVPSMVLQTMLPVLSESNSKSDTRQTFGATLDVTQSLILGSVIPIGTTLMFLSGPIMGVYGTEFDSEPTALIGAIAATLTASIGAAAGPALQAKGRVWIGVTFNLTYGAILFGIVQLMVGRFGASSITFGSAISYSILTVWAFAYLRNDLPAGMFKRVLLSLVFVICTTCACVLARPSHRLLMAAPVFLISSAVVYFVSPRHARHAQ
jgi:O-antigen/teichoic acid export membrane protein